MHAFKYLITSGTLKSLYLYANTDLCYLFHLFERSQNILTLPLVSGSNCIIDLCGRGKMRLMMMVVLRDAVSIDSRLQLVTSVTFIALAGESYKHIFFLTFTINYIVYVMETHSLDFWTDFKLICRRQMLIFGKYLRQGK